MYGQGCLFLRVASRKKVISRERAREPLQSSLTAHILMVGFVEVAVVALVVRSSSKQFAVCACDLGRSGQRISFSHLDLAFRGGFSWLKSHRCPLLTLADCQSLRGLESRGLPRECFRRSGTRIWVGRIDECPLFINCHLDRALRGGFFHNLPESARFCINSATSSGHRGG